MAHAISADGTRIAYERSGSGPAVILIDGALCSRALGPMKSVATLMASRFTVIRYDRRGRGESGNTHPYSVDREIDDLEALIQEIGGAPSLFGISSGAVLAIKAAGRGLNLGKIALFEPPIIPHRSDAVKAATPDHVARLSEFIASNRLGRAVHYFLTAMVGVPSFVVAVMRVLPVWTKLKAVAHTLPYDAELTQDGSLSVKKLAAIRPPALVIWGEKSPVFLKEAAAQVADALPGSSRRELKGQSHNASGKALVPVLSEFLQ